MKTLKQTSNKPALNNGSHLDLRAIPGGPEARAEWPANRPEPEVVPRATRRRFSVAYKRRILNEVQACTDTGQLGALLRREGLYHASLVRFRKQLARIDTASSKTGHERKRGRAGDTSAPRLAELERKNKQLERRLEQAQMIIDVQKKLSILLGLSLEANLELHPDGTSFPSALVHGEVYP